MTNIMLSLWRVDISFFWNGGYPVLEWMTLYTDGAQTCTVALVFVCLLTMTSAPIKEFLFVDWISVSVCKYVRGSHSNKAYSQLQQQIHQP